MKRATQVLHLQSGLLKWYHSILHLQPVQRYKRSVVECQYYMQSYAGRSINSSPCHIKFKSVRNRMLSIYIYKSGWFNNLQWLQTTVLGRFPRWQTQSPRIRRRTNHWERFTHTRVRPGTHRPSAQVPTWHARRTLRPRAVGPILLAPATVRVSYANTWIESIDLFESSKFLLNNTNIFVRTVLFGILQ